ncbi:MAG: transposase [Cyanobacteria bacterium P01_A01_bin.83]
MVNKKPPKIIRTDIWDLNCLAEHQLLFGKTVKIYRRLCRFLAGIVFTHWKTLGTLSTKEVVPAVERFMHATAKNPNIKYPQIGKVFHKFPSYYRRAAIVFAVGQVSSYMTRYRDWQSGIRSRKDAKPPRFNPDAGCYPVLYRGQCYKLHGADRVEIKVFTGSDWIWVTTNIGRVRERHLVNSNKMLSPSLIFNESACHLSVPFECHPAKRKPENNVVAIDLGINSTAAVTVVSFDGTVIHREFVHPGRDIDRRDARLKSISTKAKKTMGSGGRLHKGFCRSIYRKCHNINEQIGHTVSKRIVEIAKAYNSCAIVFENLKGWKPRGGRKGSTLRQRFHGWLKAKTRTLTEMKWRELGGKVIDIVAAYTSKLAYDGSGLVKRNRSNYAICRFASGKIYQTDLNGSQNIAARGIIKLTRRNDREDSTSKSSGKSPRGWAVLCDLWVRDNPKLA